MTALACYCTCPDPLTADRIAQALVDERLAYRWHGAVQRADEVLLMVKTTNARLEALTSRVRSLHPDELPELVAVEVAGGSPADLAWVAEQTRPGD